MKAPLKLFEDKMENLTNLYDQIKTTFGLKIAVFSK